MPPPSHFLHRALQDLALVQRICNPILTRRYESKCKQFNDPNVQRLFHGSGSAEGVCRNGFLLPRVRGMYGAGIYFTSDFEKASKFSAYHGTKTVLISDVALGYVLGHRSEM